MRAEVTALLSPDRYIDLVIPRGSNALAGARDPAEYADSGEGPRGRALRDIPG